MSDVLLTMLDAAVWIARAGDSERGEELERARDAVKNLIEAAGAHPVMDGLGFHIVGTMGHVYTDIGAFRYPAHAEAECKNILRAALSRMQIGET